MSEAHMIPCADVSCPQWICQRVRVPVTRAEKDARIVALEARLASLSAELAAWTVRYGKDVELPSVWKVRLQAAEKSLSEEREKVRALENEKAVWKSAHERDYNRCFTALRDEQSRREAAERGRDLALKSMKANEQTIIDLDKKLEAAEAQTARLTARIAELETERSR